MMMHWVSERGVRGSLKCIYKVGAWIMRYTGDDACMRSIVQSKCEGIPREPLLT